MLSIRITYLSLRHNDPMTKTAPATEANAIPPSGASSTIDFEPLRPERYAERVYDSLFHSIMTGRVAVGTRLPAELELAAQFQVSRPVIRQAIDRLRRDGLVASRRGSGSYVQCAPEAHEMAAAKAKMPKSNHVDLSHISYGIELRLMIEPESAALAALRRKPHDLARMRQLLDDSASASNHGDVGHHLDYGFHESIAAATANPRVLATLKGLEFDISRAVNLWRNIAQLEPWERAQDVLDEHEHIFECIRLQDPESAKRAMRAHIENARVRMLEKK